MVKIYALGTAGSGKSTFVTAMGEWMEKNGFRPLMVNLDPGVEELPYEPDVDIRDWLSLSQVMEEHGLGPNGAQVAAADMIAIHIEKIRDAMESIVYDYALIDTPGQLELFAFRSSTEYIVEKLGSEDAMLAFLFDPMLSKTPDGFASLLMLSSTVHFRFYIPFINLLSKSDVLSNEELDRILEWGESETTLYDDLLNEKGMKAHMSVEVFRALENIGAYRKLTPISAYPPQGDDKESEYLRNLFEQGLREIYYTAQKIFGAGEDLTPE